jgi:hypothetical protein
VIPVEQVRRGDLVRLPVLGARPVIRVEHYDDGAYVIVWGDTDGEHTYKILRAGDLVDVVRGSDPELPIEADDRAREAERERVGRLIREHGPLPDSEIVERYRERQADAAEALTAADSILRRRRELERRGQIEDCGVKFHVETGRSETTWGWKLEPEQISIADAYRAEEPEL